MKIVFVSSMLPSGHYSQYITNGLNLQKGIDLIAYTDKNPKNLLIKKCGEIKLVWSKSVKYIYEIIREVRNDKPDIVHLQHELNMYGGITTALLFPLLILMLRILKFRVVVTIHAAVYMKQIDKKFITLFHQESPLIKPSFLKIFFYYLFKSISLLSNSIIVHTNLKRDILTRDYGVLKSKMNVIPIAIPQKEIKNIDKKRYFFCYGYMVRRKGLGFVLEGFRKFIESNPKNKYKLVLAGGIIKGQEKAFDEIKQIIKDNNLHGKVLIKGFVGEAQLNDLYWKAYAVLIPAKISMGSSGPLFHSVSYSKCVIASKVGHFLEDIDHLKTGILTDNNKWHEAFEFAVKNPEIINLIEKNVESKARSRTPFMIAKRYIDVYSSNY